MKMRLIALLLLCSLNANAHPSQHAGTACGSETTLSRQVLNLNSYLMVGNLTCEMAGQKNYLAPYNWYRTHFRDLISRHAAVVHQSFRLCNGSGQAESNYNHLQTNLGNQWGYVAARNGAFCSQAYATLRELVQTPSDQKLEAIALHMDSH